MTEDFFERATRLHWEAVARGEHDDRCEWTERSRLCNCAMRRRIASGLTELPTEDLYFPPPSCPVCDGALNFEDGWVCGRCHISWDPSGEAMTAEWTDDYGDLTQPVANPETQK